MKRLNQAGSSIVELVIVLVVLAGVAFVGVTIYRHQHKASSTTATIQSAEANDVAAAPAIATADDLTAAETMLDQTDPTASSDADTTQLDSQLAF